MPRPLLVGSGIVATVGAALVVTVAWVLGGLEPGRQDLTWAILLAFASGIFRIWAMVMIAFDIGARSYGRRGDARRSERATEPRCSGAPDFRRAVL